MLLGRFLARQPQRRLPREDLLAAGLLGLEPLDLTANRRQELLALREPRLDLALGGSPRGDH